MSFLRSLVPRLPALVAALILAQTLWFKFSAAPESVLIFTTLGIEPWGRIASGVAELVAAILLLRARTAWMGAALALGIMAGALISHLGPLGIEVQGDGGTLFILALAVSGCCSFVLWRDRDRMMQDLLTSIGRGKHRQQ